LLKLTLSVSSPYFINFDSNLAYIDDTKIILKQASDSGVVATEVIQQHINSLATDTDITYTSQDYLNQFNDESHLLKGKKYISCHPFNVISI